MTRPSELPEGIALMTPDEFLNRQREMTKEEKDLALLAELRAARKEFVKWDMRILTTQGIPSDDDFDMRAEAKLKLWRLRDLIELSNDDSTLPEEKQ